MKILFAEDDRDLARAIKTLLEHSGYSMETVDNGTDALEYIREGEYDGVILDWMMPGLSGVEVLRRIRAEGNSVPCLMLTARDDVEDRVTGLDAGADDYLPKPFDSSELTARVRAMLRRRADYKPDLLTFADLTLDRQEMTLTCGGKSSKLGNKAFQMTEMLMERPRVVHEVNQIIERVWGWNSDSEMNVVWVTVFHLRKTLEELGTRVTIRAVRGIGYSMEDGK